MTVTARYGPDTLYGAAGLVYGAATVPRQLSWGLLIDWDNDGFFTGENEAGRIFEFESTNGREFYLRGDGSGFEPMAEGSITISLRNDDLRYDPYNPSGPLYGLIVPGRKFKVIVRDEVGAVTYPIMTGRIKDIRPIFGETNSVRLEMVNSIRELKRASITTGIFTGLRYAEAIMKVLDAFGWTAGENIDNTASSILPYWWGRGDSAYSEINSIVDVSLGLWCLDEDGTFKYLSRITPDAPVVAIGGEDIQLSYGLRAPQPWDTIRNRVRVYAKARRASALSVVWSLFDKVLILPGATVEVWANFSLNSQDVACTSVTDPVATTDYTANAAADGSGADRTSSISIAITKFATAAKLEITNGGANDAYMTLLQLRGVAIVSDEYTFAEGTDAASIAEFGELGFTVSSDWMQDINAAIDEKDVVLSRLSQIRQFPRVKMMGLPSHQFASRLLDLVEVNVGAHNISGEFRVGYVRHRWIDEIGSVIETEIYLEPNLLSHTSGSWIFPAVFDASTNFA